MKVLRESESKPIYDEFFHDTISDLPNDFKFQSVCILTTKATDDSKQFQCSNIVFCNKTKPLFVGLR